MKSALAGFIVLLSISASATENLYGKDAEAQWHRMDDAYQYQDDGLTFREDSQYVCVKFYNTDHKIFIYECQPNP